MTECCRNFILKRRLNGKTRCLLNTNTEIKGIRGSHFSIKFVYMSSTFFIQGNFTPYIVHENTRIQCNRFRIFRHAFQKNFETFSFFFQCCWKIVSTKQKSVFLSNFILFRIIKHTYVFNLYRCLDREWQHHILLLKIQHPVYL